MESFSNLKCYTPVCEYDQWIIMQKLNWAVEHFFIIGCFCHLHNIWNTIKTMQDPGLVVFMYLVSFLEWKEL